MVNTNEPSMGCAMVLIVTSERFHLEEQQRHAFDAFGQCYDRSGANETNPVVYSKTMASN